MCPDWERLRWATEGGEVTSVRKLLEKCVDTSGMGEDGMTVLMLAARKGHREIVELLLAGQAPIDAAPDSGWTALIHAIWGGHQEVVKLLLDNGADPRQTTQDRKTPLMRAAEGGHLDLVKLLVDKERSHNRPDNEHPEHYLDWQDRDGWTALTLATRREHMEIAEFLISAGANPGQPSPHGETILMAAARQGTTDLVRYLVDDIKKLRDSGESGPESDIDFSGKRGWTALGLAVQQGHLEIADLLISGGADPISSNLEGRTVLMLAAQKGQVELTRRLMGEMEKGRRDHDPCPESHIDFADKKGWTALTLAARAGHAEIVKVLFKHGANPGQATPYLRTILGLAAEGGHYDLLRHLLEPSQGFPPIEAVVSTAGVDVIDKGGWTALALATLGGHNEAAQLLIEAGADARQIAPTGRSILMLATQSGNCDLVRWLLDSDQSPLSPPDEDDEAEPDDILNAEDKVGWTALTVAASEGHGEIARFLLDMGANPRKTLPNGRTTLMVAAQHGDGDLVDELLRATGTSFRRSPRDTDDYLDVKDKDGWTALMIAACRGHHGIVCRLLTESVDPWQADPNGRTVLMHAVRDGHRGVVNELLPDKNHHHDFYFTNMGNRTRHGVSSQDINIYLHLTDQDGCPALVSAVRGGHLDIVEDLCRAGASALQPDKDGQTSLIAAVATGNYRMVRTILRELEKPEYGRDGSRVLREAVNEYDRNGQTALLIACGNGFIDIVNVLLDKGGSVFATDPSGNTALLRAAGSRSQRNDGEEDLTQIARMLLNVGADVNASNRNGQTPLSCALGNNHISLARLLVSAGANVNVSNNGRGSPLAIALVQKSIELTRILINAGANVNEADDRGQTCLIEAVLNSFTDGVRLLARSGADLDRADKRGRTALMHAAENGNLEGTQELLKAGADVTVTNSKKLTALILALRNGHADVAEAILESSIPLEPVTPYRSLMISACRNDAGEVGQSLGPDADTTSALKVAVPLGNLDVVQQLLAANADSNAPDLDGQTLLMIAAQCGHIGVVEALLEFGAKLNAVDSKGHTALMIAAKRKQHKAVWVLVNAGANTNIRTPGGNTALMYALRTQFGRKQVGEITKTLLEAGADVNLSNMAGITALMVAPDGNTVTLLLNSGADMEAVDRHGRSAFQIALEENRSLAADALREAGASIGDSPLKLPWPTYMGETVLFEHGPLTDDDVHGDETVLEVAAQNGNVDLVRELLNHGVGDRNHYSCDVALCRAAEKGYDSVAEVLVEVGRASMLGMGDGPPWRIAVENRHMSLAAYLLAAGNYEEADGEDLLMVTELGDFRLARILLDIGVSDIDYTDAYGRTSLMIAARDGNTALVSSLLDAEARRDARDDNGWTALMHAAYNGHRGVTEILAGKSADALSALIISARVGNAGIARILLSVPADHFADTRNSDRARYLALICAARGGHLDVVTTLLCAGVSGNQPSCGAQKTPLMYAAQHGHVGVVEMLLDCTYSLNARDRNGKTALMYATQNGRAEIVKLLVRDGVWADSTDKAGETALQIATKTGNTEIANLLKKRT